MNKDLHICGIGHALVDIEFTINEQQFAPLGLKKGSMALVSPQEQSATIISLQAHHPHRSSGGSAANTIIAIGQFGGKAAYKTILGNDDMGLFYADEFRQLSIHLEAEIIPNSITGTCLVLITPDAERTMLTDLGVNSSYNKDHLVEETIARSEWLYAEGYRITEPGGAAAVLEAVKIAKQHDTKIAFTFSDTFVVEVFKDRVLEILHYTDMIFCNAAEACAFSEMSNEQEAFEYLKTVCTHVVMTQGNQGATIHYDGKDFSIPAYPTIPIDTTGAGDMFAGGFLYGITNGYTIEHAGHLGSYAASKIVSQYGARLKSSASDIKKEVFSLLQH